MSFDTAVRAAGAAKPTVVLAHGALAESASWNGAQAQRFMGRRAQALSVEVDASRAVTVSQPAAVARLIDEAARATAGRPDDV